MNASFMASTSVTYDLDSTTCYVVVHVKTITFYLFVPAFTVWCVIFLKKLNDDFEDVLGGTFFLFFQNSEMWKNL